MYAAFNVRLFNFLARLSRRREVAEDLMKETWLRLADSGRSAAHDRRRSRKPLRTSSSGRSSPRWRPAACLPRSPAACGCRRVPAVRSGGDLWPHARSLAPALEPSSRAALAPPGGDGESKRGGSERGNDMTSDDNNGPVLRRLSRLPTAPTRCFAVRTGAGPMPRRARSQAAIAGAPRRWHRSGEAGPRAGDRCRVLLDLSLCRHSGRLAIAGHFLTSAITMYFLRWCWYLLIARQSPLNQRSASGRRRDTAPDGRSGFGGGTAAHSTINELESAGLEPVPGVTRQIGCSIVEPVTLSK